MCLKERACRTPGLATNPLPPSLPLVLLSLSGAKISIPTADETRLPLGLSEFWVEGGGSWGCVKLGTLRNGAENSHPGPWGPD